MNSEMPLAYYKEVRLAGRDTKRQSSSTRILRWLGIFIVLFPMVQAGCGREGAPLPPVRQVAERTRDLSAHQEGGDAVLKWSFPALTTSGGALPEVESVEVWRASLPKGQEPPPPMTSQDRALRRQLMESQGEVVAVLNPDGLAEATRGSFLVYLDDLGLWRSEVEGDPESMVLWYAVRTTCCRRQKSELSNVIRLHPQEPPAPADDLVLSASADGIDLKWTPRHETRTLVERSSDGASWRNLTPQPVVGGEWRDTTATQDSAWSYRLRASKKDPEGARVVGESSKPERIDYPDIYPPEPPQELVCLPEGNLVRVRWETVTEAVAYRISRRSGGKKVRHLSEDHTSLQFTDRSAPLGELIYLVSAVDQAGNESENSNCTVVMGVVP